MECKNKPFNEEMKSKREQDYQMNKIAKRRMQNLQAARRCRKKKQDAIVNVEILTNQNMLYKTN